MAWTDVDSGSQAATLTTEHDLVTDTTGGSYIFYIDTTVMQAGDRLELRVYVKPKSGATERLLYGPQDGLLYQDVQETPMKTIVPVSVEASGQVRYTLKQTHGTGRTYPFWGMYQ